MNDTTERIGRIALFANGLAAGNAHPTLIPDLVMLDEAGRPPLRANGAELRTDPDAPICVYAANPPLWIPGVLAELIAAINDRATFPAHRDEREQQTADAVTRLLEQATEAKIEWRSLRDELDHANRVRGHIITEARGWKATSVRAYELADAVSRSIGYRERRADDAVEAAERRHRALDDRERALVKREQRAARSVEQAVNRSNHSNELVEQARQDAASHKAIARNAVDHLTTADAELSLAKLVQAKIVEQARSWKQRALAAENAAAPGTARVEISVESIDALIGRLAAWYPERQPEPVASTFAGRVVDALGGGIAPGDEASIIAAIDYHRGHGISQHAAQRIQTLGESVKAKNARIRQLEQQLDDRDHVIALRDADVDELKGRLETAEADLSRALEDRGVADWQLAREHVEHLRTYAHLRELAARVADASETLNGTRARRDRVAMRTIAHMMGAVRTAGGHPAPIDPQAPIIDGHGQPIPPDDARRSARRTFDDVNPFGNIIDNRPTEE